MVGAVIGSLKDVRPPNWALSDSYLLYIQKTDAEAVEWIPELTYYIGLVRRLVDSKLLYIHYYIINNNFFRPIKQSMVKIYFHQPIGVLMNFQIHQYTLSI